VGSFPLGEFIFAQMAVVISHPIGPVSATHDSQVNAHLQPRIRICTASPWVSSATRRLLECFVAAAALLALLPVLVICWALVRLSSPGPALFRQYRMGRDGNEFIFYKFRSMRTDADPNGPSHTVHGDERITRVGAFLRRYKLDELPQFWNVFVGDMSLVGPRPKLSHHEALHMSFRPGITGQATLAFRNEEQMLLDVPLHEVDSFYESVVKPIKAELDLAYMEQATLASDIRMLWRTFVSCAKCSQDPWQEVTAMLERFAKGAAHSDSGKSAALRVFTATRLSIGAYTPAGRHNREVMDVIEFAEDLDDAA
jgi:lipopolysaccharide/colanic/teichoic acid biosynthesis glycosyltransferase